MRLAEAVIKQAAKDYISEYKKFGHFSKPIEEYFRRHPLMSSKADYIIETLRKEAISKTKVKRKTHRVCVNGKEI